MTRAKDISKILTDADISGNIDVDGVTNLDVVDIDGAVDMASTLQVDGAITSSSGMTITTADNNPQLTIISTDADASRGAMLDLVRNSASPSDNDLCGTIRGLAKNSAGEDVTLGEIIFRNEDVTDGTEDGQIILNMMRNGASAQVMKLSSTETVLNGDSVDLDFRVEGNGDANLFICDAGNDDVYIHRNNSTINSTNRGTVFNSGDGVSSFKTSADAASDEVAVQFYGTAGKCFIYGNGNVNNDNGTFGNFSDQTLKENIVDAQSQWADIKALQIRNFNLISNPNLTQLGVVAQELEASGMNGLVEELIIDDEKNTKKAVKTSVLYMKGLKALQEAMTRIETLEAKVTTLENA